MPETPGGSEKIVRCGASDPSMRSGSGQPRRNSLFGIVSELRGWEFRNLSARRSGPGVSGGAGPCRFRTPLPAVSGASRHDHFPIGCRPGMRRRSGRTVLVRCRVADRCSRVEITPDPRRRTCRAGRLAGSARRCGWRRAVPVRPPQRALRRGRGALRAAARPRPWWGP